MRQVEIRRPAEIAEDFEEQRGGGDTVHVVVAEDDQRFGSLAGGEEVVHCGGHVRQREGIGETAQTRFEKKRDGLWFAVPAVEEALREQRGDAGLLCECGSERGL